MFESLKMAFSSPYTMVGLAGVAALIGLVVLIMVLSKAGKPKAPAEKPVKAREKAIPEAPAQAKPVAETCTEEKPEEAPVKPESEPVTVKSVLGTGTYRVMVIRNPKRLGLSESDNVVDFTTMPAPIGEVHMADASCPLTGGMFTVREKEDGTLEDYDPREREIDVKQTPEYAYYATHWDVVADVFAIPSTFWKSPYFWFAVGAMAITFFVCLAAIGG